jgi:hypothetical protein
MHLQGCTKPGKSAEWMAVQCNWQRKTPFTHPLGFAVSQLVNMPCEMSLKWQKSANKTQSTTQWPLFES